VKVKTDWHMHSRHSSCGKHPATIAVLAKEVTAAGIEDFGVTDHMHWRHHIPMIAACYAEYVATKKPFSMRFGLEISALRKFDLEQFEKLGWVPSQVLTKPAGTAKGEELRIYWPEEFISTLKIDYLIGSAHFPIGAREETDSLINCYHNQLIFLASQPKVNIIGHPWCWNWPWFRDKDTLLYHGQPWLEDFAIIPVNKHLEFAGVCKKNGKAIEINAKDIILNRWYPPQFRVKYMDYLKLLKQEGVTFSLGSDSHQPGYSDDLHKITDVFDILGLKENDVWMHKR